MAIKFKHLTLRNFLSIGNITQSIDFDQHDLTLILGENLDQGGAGSGQKNGVGKSSATHAISYALYGQPLAKIKVDNLVNRINDKNMIVTLSFEKDGINYRIERGRKPSIFKLYVNESLHNETNDAQGDSRDTQNYIDDLLSMNHTMYKNIVSLNTYSEPFLAMKAADQREIIENLLGITILSEKASALKELIRESKDAVTKEQAIIDATAQANQKIQESVNLLIRRQLNWKTQRDDDCIDLHHKIEKLKDIDIGVELRNHELLKKYNDNYTKFENISQQKQTVAASVTQAEKTVSRYFNELETLDNNKCPQCSQSISDHKHFEMMETVAKLYQDAADYLSQVNAQAELLQEDYDRVSASLPKIKPTTIYKSLEQALKHQNYLENYEKSLKQKINEPDPYQDQIDELKQSAIQRISYDKINELIKIKDHQEFLLKLLTNKDSFIRKKIIDQNLSYLNTRLSTYLEKIGLPHRVIFHNDLSVEISHMGHDSDFHNLSRGEMTRLSLSLSFAFRDVWENLYQPINMMVIDEQLDSGTDAAGVFAAVDILQSMVYERNKNIFLISHKEELTSKINNVLIATKENGFTSYAFL